MSTTYTAERGIVRPGFFVTATHYVPGGRILWKPVAYYDGADSAERARQRAEAMNAAAVAYDSLPPVCEYHPEAARAD